MPDAAPLQIVGAPPACRRNRAGVTFERQADGALTRVGRRHLVQRVLLRAVQVRGTAALIVPARNFLVKPLEAPKSATASLSRIAQLAIEKGTPFGLDEVYWAVQDPVRAGAGRMTASLVILPKRSVEASLAEMRAAGVAPRLIQSDDGRYSVTLPEATIVRWRWITALAVLVGLIGIGSPWELQQRELAALRARLATAGATATPAIADDGRAAIWTAYRAEKARLGDAIGLLAELTRLLPDDAYIEAYTQRDGTLDIRGMSASASALAARVAESTLLRDVRLGGPTVAGEDDQQRFVILADIAAAAQ